MTSSAQITTVRESRKRKTMRGRVVAMGLVAFAGAAFAACDPCAGLSTCSGGAVLSYSGRVVNERGMPVEGASVSFSRTSGVALSPGTLSDVTGSDGRFLLHASAGAYGETLGDLSVAAPGQSEYTADGLALATMTRGETRQLEDVIDRPYLSYLLSFRLRATGEPLSGASVQLIHREGVATTWPSLRRTTEGAGYLWVESALNGYGDAGFEAFVAPAGRAAALEPVPISLPAFYSAGQSEFREVFVGPSLAYGGRVYHPDETRVIANVQVAFQRTGGLALAEDSVEAVTTKDGVFFMFLDASDPYETGEVVGRLHLHPPAPYESITIADLRVPTFNEDGVRLLGEWVLQ